MYREETIRDLEDIRVRHESGDLDDYSKDQHVMMILNEFLNNVGFDDVADALFRVNDEFKQDEFE
jgi:hypothetical protein|tara:strand:- start:151 stop:345 length:195 start_codon:yes stop_codon:yes gene_type:complete